LTPIIPGAAGRISGDPALKTFGPNMMLAKELLDQGRTDAVLQYFQLCGRFWESDRGRLQQWTEEVEGGKLPEFGANLVY
jgi:hypothetical protein